MSFSFLVFFFPLSPPWLTEKPLQVDCLRLYVLENIYSTLTLNSLAKSRIVGCKLCFLEIWKLLLCWLLAYNVASEKAEAFLISDPLPSTSFSSLETFKISLSLGFSVYNVIFSMGFFFSHWLCLLSQKFTSFCSSKFLWIVSENFFTSDFSTLSFWNSCLLDWTSTFWSFLFYFSSFCPFVLLSRWIPWTNLAVLLLFLIFKF